MSWEKKDIDFLKRNVGIVSFKEIAERIGKTEMAVQIYCHRYRIPIGGKSDNLLMKLLTIRFIHPEYFMPTRQFFDSVKINQKRWWCLYYGKSKLTEEEYKRLVKHFGVGLDNAFDARQLDLFDHD